MKTCRADELPTIVDAHDNRKHGVYAAHHALAVEKAPLARHANNLPTIIDGTGTALA